MLTKYHRSLIQCIQCYCHSFYIKYRISASHKWDSTFRQLNSDGDGVMVKCVLFSNFQSLKKSEKNKKAITRNHLQDEELQEYAKKFKC